MVVQIAIGFWLSAPVYRGPVTDHFNGKKFFTPGGNPAKGLGEVFKWMISRKRSPWKEQFDLPFGEKPPQRIDTGTRITFVNHSTFLIQTEGINFLTDPVWSQRVSPFTWAGPARMRPPGIRFEDLPKIDIVLLSHNHYDHLDIETMKRIFAAHHPRILTSLGVSAFLKKEGVHNSEDLDWWDEVSITAETKVQAVPAQHFSGRGTFDRDGTLWSGFVVKVRGGSIYFAGDSGYNSSLFTEIRSRCAPIDIALVPIGAFKPQWFMSPIHCSPSEAVQIHLDIKASQSIATHFGTFPLADDGQQEPIEELRHALRERQLPENTFIVLKEGEGRSFK